MGRANGMGCREGLVRQAVLGFKRNHCTTTTTTAIRPQADATMSVILMKRANVHLFFALTNIGGCRMQCVELFYFHVNVVVP